jgi:hypothetical protein
MSTSLRVHEVSRLFVVTSIFLCGISSAAVKAEPGNEPTVQYANLPSDRTDPVKRLPEAGQRSLGGFSPFDVDVEKGRITLRETAPTQCLPGPLRSVIADLSSRFGTVSIQSTHRSRSHNWQVGGVPHSLHLSCRAIDFRIRARAGGVMAYLRSRPEVGGLKIYRNGIIHVDDGERRSW